jgi:hypothetical protein
MSSSFFHRLLTKFNLYPKHPHADIKKPLDLETIQLIRNLEKEYHRTDFFRQDRVIELSAKIKHSEYHVAGKDIVEKWFAKR